MSAPDWYPKAETLPGILAPIARLVGVDAALRFAETFGGARVYVPRPETIGRDHILARGLGIKAARVLASTYQGDEIKVPVAKVERTALACRRLWAEGRSIKEICRTLHLTEAWARVRVAGIERSADPAELTNAEPDRCPACGRRHRRPRPVVEAAPDPRQMSLPLGAPTSSPDA